MEFVQIEVKEREERGSAAVRRMRRDGYVPAVLYGLQRRNLPLTISTADLVRFIGTGSHLVELRMGDETRDAILREVQSDPITDEILHVDFVRVDKDATIEDHVPVRYKGTAPGTKEGGLFQGLLDHITVRARPRDLPEETVLDVTQLHVGDAIRVKDVSLPDDVISVDAPEELVCHVVLMRGRTTLEEEEEADAESAGEPEVIGKGTDASTQPESRRKG